MVSSTRLGALCAMLLIFLTMYFRRMGSELFRSRSILKQMAAAQGKQGEGEGLWEAPGASRRGGLRMGRSDLRVRTEH